MTTKINAATAISGILPVANGGTGSALGANPIWAIKTANYTAVASDSILANTTAGAFSVTLPASPVANTVVRIADYVGTFGTNNLTIVRNGSLIMGLSEDMTISRTNASIILTYIDATVGWKVL